MTNMKLAVAAAIAICAMPLFSLVAPYKDFCLRLIALPLPWSDPHMQEAMRSAHRTLYATACLHPFMAQLPFVCPSVAHSHGHPLPHDVARGQHELYEQVIRLAPRFEALSALATIGHAAELAIAFDDYVMMLEEGQAELFGIGDISLLVKISRVSLLARGAIHNVLIHVELAITRAVFIQEASTAMLTVLNWYGLIGSHTSVFRPPQFGDIAAICSAATSSSILHVLSDLAGAIATTLDLLHSLKSFHVVGTTQHQCTKFAAVLTDLCSEIAPLYKGVASLEHILVILISLEEVLESALDESSSGETLSDGYPFAVSLTLTKAEVAALQSMAAGITKSRQAGNRRG